MTDDGTPDVAGPVTGSEQDEETEDVLAPVVAELDDIAGDLKRAISYGGSPEDLEIRADRLERIARRLADLPARLHEDIGLSLAEATARRAADEAAEDVTEAENAVAAAQAAHEATAGPELAAEALAAEARQGYERARDEHEQAVAQRASDKVVTEADMRVTSAARTAETRSGELAAARERRQAAKADLDKARDRLRQAQEALDAAEAAAVEPATADLDMPTLLGVMRLSWTYRLDGAVNGTLPKLTDNEFHVIRFLATNTCDEQSWRPPGAVEWARRQQGAEMAAEVRQGRGVTIYDRRGALTLGLIRPGDRVSAPGSIASTGAHGR
jgi:hypothetical protein